MPLVENMNNVVDDIVSSYESRIQSIETIFDATQQSLEGFQNSFFNTKQERETVNLQLRDILAKNESLRKKDFDSMMQSILLVQEQREKDVKNVLRNYIDGQRAMAQALRQNLKDFRDSLAKNETHRVKGFHTAIKELLTEQDEKRAYVNSTLKEFNKDQKVLTLRFKELLAKGKQVRIKDFKVMLKEFKCQREKRLMLQKKRKEEVASMLGSFRKKRGKAVSSKKAIHPLRKEIVISKEIFNGVNIDARDEQQKKA